MSFTASRTAAGEAVQGGLEGSSNLARFHAAINPSGKQDFKSSRPSGALADTAVALMKEHSESSVKGDVLMLAELAYFLTAAVGDRVTTAAGPLFRHRFTVPTFTVPKVDTLTFVRGKAAQAEAVKSAVTKELSITVNQNGTEASLSATLLGTALDTAGDIGAATQTVAVGGAPTAGDFELTVAGKTTGAIPFDATAAQVEAALNAVLGAGFTVCTGGPVNNGAVTIKFVGATGAVAAATYTDTFDAGATLTVTVVHDGTPAPELPAEPVAPGQVAVYIGDTRPDFDGAADVNAGTGYLPKSYDWSLSDLFVDDYTLDGDGVGPSAFLPNVGRKGEVKVWVDGNAAGTALYTKARTGGRFYVTAHAVTTGGASLTIHTACQVSGTGDFGEANGAFGYEVTFTPVHEDAWAGSQLIEVVTAAKLA